MSESLTVKQVAEHNTAEKGLYIIIDGDVYKLDTFVEEHPGGSKILKRVGGKDASKQFWKYHNEGVLKKYGAKLKIGSVKEEAKL
ncbi:cytochrome protein [Pyrenophora tritici-repentis]|nr:cytochrome protein [Pyrenophora tritici-repentis]